MKFWWMWKRRERELNKEIAYHLCMAAQEQQERGQPPAEAASRARREFGNVGLAKETARDMWGWRWLKDSLEDVRYGTRTLQKQPGFAVIANMPPYIQSHQQYHRDDNYQVEAAEDGAEGR